MKNERIPDEIFHKAQDILNDCGFQGVSYPLQIEYDDLCYILVQVFVEIEKIKDKKGEDN